jgi:hypothetical protein
VIQGRELGEGDLGLIRTLPTEHSEWGPDATVGVSGLPHSPLCGRGVS